MREKNRNPFDLLLDETDAVPIVWPGGCTGVEQRDIDRERDPRQRATDVHSLRLRHHVLRTERQRLVGGRNLADEELNETPEKGVARPDSGAAGRS